MIASLSLKNPLLLLLLLALQSVSDELLLELQGLHLCLRLLWWELVGLSLLGRHHIRLGLRERDGAVGQLSLVLQGKRASQLAE